MVKCLWSGVGVGLLPRQQHRYVRRGETTTRKTRNATDLNAARTHHCFLLGHLDLQFLQCRVANSLPYSCLRQYNAHSKLSSAASPKCSRLVPSMHRTLLRSFDALQHSLQHSLCQESAAQWRNEDKSILMKHRTLSQAAADAEDCGLCRIHIRHTSHRARLVRFSTQITIELPNLDFLQFY